MGQTVKLRRSAISGKIPINSQLQLGELSMNTTDGKIFLSKSGSNGPSVEEVIITNTQNFGNIDLVGDLTATNISSSFIGDGSGLYNIPATGVTGLSLDRIASSTSTASIDADGLHINTDTTVTGSLTATEFTGSGLGLTNVPIKISGSDEGSTSIDSTFTRIKFDDSTGIKISGTTGGDAVVYLSGVASESDGGEGKTAKLVVTTPTSTWTLNHNLNEQHPSIEVFDTDNEVIIPQKIDATSENQVVVSFASPQAGTVTATVGGGLPSIDSGYENRVLSVDNDGNASWKTGILSGSIDFSTLVDTGSFNTYTSSNDNTNNNQNGRLDSLEEFTSSIDDTYATDSDVTTLRTDLNTYTSSNDNTNSDQNGRLDSIESFTSSIDDTYATDTDVTTLRGDLNTYTSSNDNTNSDQNGRLGSLEITSGSQKTKLGEHKNRLDSLELTSGSHDGRLDSIESKTGSFLVSNDLSTIEGKIGSLETTSGSHDGRLDSLETTSGSHNGRITDLETFETKVDAGLEFTGSNVTIKGNLLVKGTETRVDSTTVDIDDNILSLNGSGAVNAGLEVRDTESPGVLSGSLIYDTGENVWKAGIKGSEERLLINTDLTTLDGRLDSLESTSGSHKDRLNRIETSTSSLNSFTSSIDTTIKDKLNNDGVISGSVQIDHDATTNYVGNEHIDHSTITIGSGKGLTGGGTIDTSRSLTLDTGSAHFLGGVKSKLNTETVVSGSVQIDITGTTNYNLVDGRLDSIESFTSSIDDTYATDSDVTTLRTDLNTYTSSNDSTNTTQDGRLDSLESNSGSYLTSFTETDPIFTASPSAGITETNITNWDSAYTYSTVGHLPLSGGTITGGNLVINDNDELRVGLDSDLRLYHNGTNNFILNTVGDLNIRNTADDGNIIFQSDDGLGSYTNYFIIDGGNEQTQVYKDFRFQDNVIAKFGNSSDLQIYHDGSNSYIKDSGIGNLRIRSTSLRLEGTGSENMAVLNEGGDVSLYYNAVKKFNTTNTGISVSGTIVATGYNDSNWNTAYGWGDHSQEGYLTSFTETDPIFTASPAAGITDINITNWDAAYGWGDHSTEGYVKNDEYTTGATFNNTNGVITFTRNDGDTFSVDVDGRYLTSFTETDTLDSVTDRGSSTSNTITVGELTTTKISTPTDNNLYLYPTGNGHLYLGDSGNGMNMYHYSQQNNGKYTTFTHNGNYYRISPTATLGLEITSNTRITGTLTASGYNDGNWNTAYGWGDHSTVGYLTSYNDEYTTGATFNGGNGIITFTRNNGDQYTVDISSTLTDVTVTGGTYNDGTQTLTLTKSDGNSVDVTGFAIESVKFTTGATFNSGNGIITFNNNDATTYTVDIDNRYLQLGGGTLTGNLTLNSVNPEILFNGTSDVGVDMAIKATPEGLDFYEPEDGNKIHFQILDDTGVNAVFGLQIGGTQVLSSSRVLTNVTGNISMFTNDSNYLTSFTETDPIFTASPSAGITDTNIENWNEAYGWGDHASAGYLTSFTEIDTLDSVTDRGATTSNVITVGGVNLNDSNSIIEEASGNAFRFKTSTGYIDIGSKNSGWIHFEGNRPYYFGTSYSAFDGDVRPYTNNTRSLGSTTHRWAGIYANGGDSSQWNTAYGWGDHSQEGYLTSFTETDPIFTASPSAGITDINITNWDAAYGWGDHASAGYISSFTDTNEFVSGATFNTGNGVITFTRNNGGDTFTLDIDGRHVLKSGDVMSGTLEVPRLQIGNASFGPSGDQNHVHFVGTALIPNTSTTSSNSNMGTSTYRWKGVYGGLGDFSGTVTASGGNSGNWNTAYGWGDHSTEGYLTSSSTQSKYLRSDTSDTFTGDVLGFPTLSLGIANNNSDNGYDTYFRGSSTHFVLGLTAGNTLFLNYGNDAGSMRTYGSWLHGDTQILTNGRVLTNVTNTNWDTAYGWGDHSQEGYLTSYTETDTLSTVTARGRRTHTNGSDVWDVTTPGLGEGSIHVLTVNTDHAGGAITFNASDANNAQAGIYVKSDGSYGTKMYIATTDSYATGSKTAISIDHNGLVNITRGNNRLQVNGNRVHHAGDFTTTDVANGVTAYGWGDHSLAGYTGDQDLSSYATQTYVGDQISNLVDSAPGTLDTLNELAAALGDDPNFATTITNSIATKLPLAGGVMSGNIGRSAHNNGYLVGGYNNIGASASATNPIFTIGTSYLPAVTTLGNMYGIGYTRADASFMGVASGSGWGMYVAADGDARIWLDGSTGNIVASGTLSASGYNDTNWNTAYGWDDHSTQGYLTTETYTAHEDTSTLNGNYGGGNNGVVVEDITVDSNGHVTAVGTRDLDGRFMGQGQTLTSINTIENGGNRYDPSTNNPTNEHYAVLTYGNGGNVTGQLATHFQTGDLYSRGYNSSWSTWKKYFNTDDFTTTNVSNWNTAYGWGDHSLVGYITGYNETDTLDSVTNRGANTVNNITTGIHTITKLTSTSGTQGTTLLELANNVGSDISQQQTFIDFKFTDTNDNWTPQVRIGAQVGQDASADSQNTEGAGAFVVYTGDGSSTSGTLNESLRVSYDGDTTIQGVLTATGGNSTQWNTAYGWGDHASAGYTSNTGTLTDSNDRNYITDSRGAARAPSYYDDRYAQWDFQNASDTGVGGDAWHALLTVSKWASFDPSHRQEQLIFSGDHLWRRTATSDSAWGTNKKIWDSGNLTNNSGNWDTAYGWGDHASAGYLTSLPSHNHDGRYLLIGGKAADSELLDGIDSGTFMRRDTNVTLATGSKFTFHSGGGGTTFGNNHYSMGVDIANGGWSNPNYSDLIIGYHTGIRIGAAYGGTRFYNNSPTTDTNNTGNGDGNEGLIMTVGGNAGSNSIIVQGNVTASGGNSTQWNQAYGWGDHNSPGYARLGSSNSFTNSYNEFGDGTGSVSNDGSWNARVNVAGSSHARLDVKSVSDGIITTMYSHTGNNRGKIGTMSDHALGLLVNGTERATLHSSGRLEVGGPIDAVKINLTGEVNIDNSTSNKINFNDSSAYWLSTSNNWGLYWDTSSNSLGFHGSGTERGSIDLDNGNLQMDGTGRFGSYITTDQGQTRSKIRLWDTDTNYAIGFKSGYDFGHLGNSFGTGGEYAISFMQNNNSARGFWWGHSDHSDAQGAMALTADGRLNVAKSVSIGEGENKINPSDTPLYVEGTTAGETVFEVQGTSGQLFSITDSLIGDIFEVSDISGIPILTVNSSGVVTVDDTLHVTGDVIAYYASDKRLKDNIKPIENAIDKIKMIGGYEFDWNSKSRNNNGHDVGVIAQEIEEVLPELVGTRSDGYKGVKYEKLTALLIQSNKELIARVEELESKLKK